MGGVVWGGMGDCGRELGYIWKNKGMRVLVYSVGEHYVRTRGLGNKRMGVVVQGTCQNYDREG